MTLKKKQLITLRKIKNRPVLGTIPWSDIESLFVALGAEVEEREGSRVAIVLNGTPHVFHRPHPSPDTDKGAVASVKRILMSEFPTLFDN
ncbi:type II toxin-antitoxin system HicA family toxin [Vibrio vulnificus]|nr:type II toxin-antitoxin system HicA family toxin [Vibrio vulnificus]AIL73606.1 toxin-antitoxin systems (TAS) HicA [Vibrio vulnificus]EGQ7854864.1 type II toxin-antitoxin system HicA family toxin [Vibrio vulnificus]EIA1300445.1 type II toxin-antitoxin system HicA family toxin [Vibrio vulnificus]EIO3980519.1 type II toxin-antitoxin system HicA family toxin [Vibrio vulnificus]EIZ4627424.1 type II toxin-antitoxin system HicA family toxin [Vibrio vulnificus]